MSTLWEGTRHVFAFVKAIAISGPGFLATAAWTATAALGERFTAMIGSGLVEDLREIKRIGLTRLRAGSDEKVAKAAEAVNKASVAGRNDCISRAEAKMKLAEAAKTDAEAKALLIKAEADAAKSRADAAAKLADALAKLKLKGGTMAVDPEQLAQFGIHFDARGIVTEIVAKTPPSGIKAALERGPLSDDVRAAIGHTPSESESPDAKPKKRGRRPPDP